MSDDQSTQASQEIYSFIEDQLGRKEVDTNVSRASATNSCVRKNWLKHKGVQGEPLQPRMILVFGFGDLVEHWAKALIKLSCVGPGKLYSEVDFGPPTGEKFVVQHREFDVYKQEDLKVELPNITLSAHGDGWGKRNSDGEWEYIEVKSSSSYGFDNFVACRDGEHLKYINQLHAVMLSDKAKKLGVRSSRLFYLNKNTSHIFDRLYQYDNEVARNMHRLALAAVGEAEPAPPYELTPEQVYNRSTKTYDNTGRMIVPAYPCGYCEFKAHCYSEVEREFKSGKPVWVYRPKKVSGNE